MLMMLEKPRRTPALQVLDALSDGLRRVAATVDAILAAPFHWAENRRTMAVLAAMNDHALQDIGLTRHDLNDAWSLPIATDPTGLLAARRNERRYAR